MRLFFVFILLIANLGNAQTIFSIEKKDISAENFERIYKKNKTNQFSEEILSVEEYLDLFINFHLKVYEAEQLGIPNEEKFKTEFTRFYKQLADNQIANGEVTEEMIKEVYHRLKNEVRVSHILIGFPNNSESPKADAYIKALQINEEIEKGENFEVLAEKYSQDPSVKINKGDIGWFKAFKMVTPFEDEAYALKVGEVSMPIETQFGYHIIKKTGERASMGKLSVAHIMLYSDEKNKTEKAKRIDEIYNQIKAGESFQELAMQYSEDTNSAERGGVMVPFEIGSLNSQIFENEAFNLTKNGQISKPFKTRFGWHIIKRLDSEDVASYEELKPFISKKIKTSERAKLLNNRIQEKLSEYHRVEVNKEAILHFEKATEILIQNNQLKYENKKEDSNKIAFTIDEFVYTWGDLADYLNKNQRGIELGNPIKNRVKDLINDYTYEKLVDAHKKILMDIDPEFNLTVNEYKDGLLLYEIMDREVWSKAKNDSLGIVALYNKNQNRYFSEEELEVEIIRATTKKEAKKIKDKGASNKKLADVFPKAIFTPKEWKKVSSSSLPKNLKKETNETNIYFHNNQYLIITIHNYKHSFLKPLEEIKGKVINDYQEEIEKKWLSYLKQKYTVVINEEVVRQLKQKLE